ncbi:MAG TPA: GAF domain-containing sensor histidine kinase, partial [Candidatus Bathyarchaeia archaeon]|nr:GAF domain-containing sensor histidine kinase [Candidatus Bathyarchaeia archaeon]
LLKVSLNKTMELFGATRGSLFIFDEHTKGLVLRAACGLKWTETDPLVKKMGEGVVGRVAEMKKPIFVTDIASDERFENYPVRPGYQTPSFICAPLLIKDVLIGVINMADKQSGYSFGEEEVQLLDFLATQIALNYRRVEIYQKFKLILKESQDLKDELGKSSQETSRLKHQMVTHEKLATLGKLAGGIAHEFNNPLDGVIRYTNLCLQHAGEDEILRGYLLEIKGGLNRMANVVRSLLDCSRGETSSATQKVDVNAAVVQAVDSLKIDIGRKSVIVEKRLGAGLPMMIDFGLERIVENLLRNAIDAVSPGGKIIVTTAKDDQTLTLTVYDNGCGIANADDVSKIFQPFYTTKESDRGCGLGLTIVSEVVKAYEGQIDVDSWPGRGTAFIITLPLAVNSEEKS